MAAAAEGGKEAVGWGGHRRHSDPLSLPPPRPPPDRRGPVHRQLEPWVEMVNAGMIVVQRPLSSVFKKWTYEDKAQFWSLDPGLVCLPDRRTPRPVHKLNKNSMTATTSDAARRGATKYTVCPRDRRPHPPSDEVRRLRLGGQKEREAVPTDRGGSKMRGGEGEEVGPGQVPRP